MELSDEDARKVIARVKREHGEHALMHAVLRHVKRWLDMPVPTPGEVLPTFDQVSKAVDEVLALVEREEA